MDVDLGTFRILGLIAHEVPIPGEGVSGPVLSEVETPLETDWRNYFRERVVESLHRSFEVGFVDSTPSPVPELIRTHFANQTRFVPMSQQLAAHLYSCQSRRNPSGLLVVTRGQFSVEDKAIRAVAILKLEKESGIRATQTTFSGKRSFAIQQLHDLMLTQKTKVFKAALFHESDDEPICSHVSDNQLGFQPTTEIAAFFLRFLGCESKQDAQVATKRFFQATEQFINTGIDDGRMQTRYHIALLAEMQNENPLISPAAFAGTHLNVADRSKYLSWLASAGITDNSYAKDTALVKWVIGQTELRMTSGISISGPPERFEKSVHLLHDEDGQIKIEIKGEVAKLRGRPKRKDVAAKSAKAGARLSSRKTTVSK